MIVCLVPLDEREGGQAKKQRLLKKNHCSVCEAEEKKGGAKNGLGGRWHLRGA